MTKAWNVAAVAAIVAVGLAALPGAGEAAWWKFGRDKAKVETETAVPEADAGGVVVAQSQAQGSDRFNRIENTLRNLTGQVEQLTFQLRQLQEQVQRAQEDNEFRFKELETGQGGIPKKAAKAAPTTDDASAVATTEPPAAAVEESPQTSAAPAEEQSVERLDEAAAPDGKPGEAVLGAPPTSIGTLIIDEPPPDGANQPIDLSAMAKGAPEPAPGQTAALVSTGDPATDFKAAYDQTVRGDYDLAEAGFRQFLANYPTDPRAAEAQYWIGDSLFSRGRYGEAAAEFRNGYKKFPQSPKGAETLLKIGMSATATEDFASACKIYAQLLKQYPQASNALKQRVKVEQASAGC